MAWTDDFQFINKHTMFLLQLHPMYRAFYAVVYAVWGTTLIYFGNKHVDNSCAMSVAKLDIVIGAGLCLGSLCYMVGLLAKRHHYQGDEHFPVVGARELQELPFPKILVIDWLLTVFVGFIGFGLLNFWYFGFVTEDDSCHTELKNVNLAYVVYCYVQFLLICLSVVCIAFQVSGPSYIYQDVVHDLDPPDFLIQKFGHQSQHYGSTVSLTVPDYPEPRLANNPRAFDIERRSFPQGTDQDLGGGNDLFDSVQVSRQIEL